jgi:hypothetical protein
VDFVQQHAAAARADARHRTPQRQGVGILALGRFETSECSVATQMSVGGDEREVDRDTLVHRWLDNTVGDAVTIGLGGEVLPDGRQVILAVGRLHGRQQLTPFVRQRHAPPAQIARGSHGGGIDRGLGPHPTAAQDGNCLGVNLVMCGLTARDRLHGEGLAADERDAVGGAQSGEPGPR